MVHKDPSELSQTRKELRERIILTAIDAFEKHGIKSVTMDEIAASLSISKRTLYEIFRDKETLLEACVERRHELFKQSVDALVQDAENVIEVIMTVYKRTLELYHSTHKRFFEDLAKYPRLKAINRHSEEEEAQSQLNFFRKGVEQGIFRDDINFLITRELSRVQMSLLNDADVCRRFSFEEVFESIVLVGVRGICTEKGRAILDEYVKNHRI
ncbi:MAG: TetR/AcrR family transcriptional regulator [Bacteroidaceae bacterium]